MTHKHVSYFFFFFSACVEKFDQTSPTVSESYPELQTKHKLVYPEYIYVSRLLYLSSRAQSSLTKKNLPDRC